MKNKTAAEFAKEYYQLETSGIESVRIKSAILFAERFAAQFEQKWQEVDSNDLPKGEVIAWNGYEHHLGTLYNADGYVICTSDEVELPNVTHYQKLTTPTPKK